MSSRTVCFLLLPCLVAGCAASRTSGRGVLDTHQPQVIALAPGGGPLAEAVGFALAQRGITVIDATTTTDLMARFNLNEFQISQPAGLAQFARQGVDGVLIVHVVAAADQLPQSATARLASTHDGHVLTGITWQNGFAGRRGSIADRVMRKDLIQAADEIAAALYATR